MEIDRVYICAGFNCTEPVPNENEFCQRCESIMTTPKKDLPVIERLDRMIELLESIFYAVNDTNERLRNK